MSESEEMQKGENEITLPLSNIDSVILVLDSIMAKGGHCSRDVLKTTVGKDEAAFGWALSSATEFGLIDYKGREYSLSPLGNKFSAANIEERKQIMREIILNYQPYHTILLRLKNAPENSLSKADITKAWYELTKKGQERTRQQNTGSFASICEWCGLVENRKKTVILKEEGKSLISATTVPKAIAGQDSSTAVGDKKKEEARESGKQTPPQVQLNTAITINITVDTKEQASVENLIRILKTLKGEDMT